MSLRARATLGALLLALAAGALYLVLGGARAAPATSWLRAASPGPLSAAHATLEGSCASCHRAGGVDAARCVPCHAAEAALLARESTAFHATARDCRGCHPEHRGRDARPTRMDHRALARLAPGAARGLAAFGDDLRAQLGQRGPTVVASAEARLECATCHRLRDRHVGMFGAECATCHGTAGWAVEGYHHPSSRSTDCAQCHRPPRSHTMEHFGMISQPVAGHPEARVDQCYLCHKTTAWNDIRGVGWFECH